MNKLRVLLQYTPDERRPVGQLAESRGSVFFEYDPEFLRAPLWLSPFKLPPVPGLHEHTDRAFGPLFGLFDDSLPDGWGLLLMDRAFRRAGRDPHAVGILERLAYLGSETMGALVYEPAMPREDDLNESFDLGRLAREAVQVLDGDVQSALPLLQRAGGSPGGARPKVLVGVQGDRLISGHGELPEGFSPWIIKFPARQDDRDAGTIEFAYARMATAAGLVMPETRLFEAGRERFFGARRFDRQDNRRVHTHTLGNLIHSNFRVPSCDYADFFKVVRILTKNHQDLRQAFRRMVFNVLTHNRDDHVKNVSFCLDESGDWRLAPAYDLTFAPGPGGEHSMTVRGEGKAPGRREMWAVGRGEGLRDKDMAAMYDEVRAAVEQWPVLADEAGVSGGSVGKLRAVIARMLAMCGH
jgi:serine/threonine-protein kinase HipA